MKLSVVETAAAMLVAVCLSQSGDRLSGDKTER
jgi:hypothetical protein